MVSKRQAAPAKLERGHRKPPRERGWEETHPSAVRQRVWVHPAQVGREGARRDAQNTISQHWGGVPSCQLQARLSLPSSGPSTGWGGWAGGGPGAPTPGPRPRRVGVKAEPGSGSTPGGLGRGTSVWLPARHGAPHMPLGRRFHFHSPRLVIGLMQQPALGMLMTC